jgi:hypothetical protein
MKLAKSILHCCGITHRLVTMIARSAPFSMGQMAWSQSRCQVTAMTSAWGRLHIEVRDGEIFVTLPGTSYRAGLSQACRQTWANSHAPFRQVGAGRPDDAKVE